MLRVAMRASEEKRDVFDDVLSCFLVLVESSESSTIESKKSWIFPTHLTSLDLGAAGSNRLSAGS